MPQGTIRDFDVDQGSGSLLQDDRREVGIDIASLEGSGIRYLRVGQRVAYDLVEEGGRPIARNLKIVSFA